MKVANYIIQHLVAAGIDRAFLVQGAANNDLIYAIADTPGINYVCNMHEQSSGFCAEGWSKVTGKPGLAIATSGPGGGNLVTPIQNCFYDSVPCIFLTGQINSRFLRPDPSLRQVGFQETDIVGIVSPITKYAKMVTRPENIRYELEKALFLCQDGRPGPVLLDLPIDVQQADINPDKLSGFKQPPDYNYRRGDLIYLQMSKFLTDFQRAKRPVILIGGGARNAALAVRQLGIALRAPCFPTWNALDIITSDYEFYGGRVGTYGGSGRNFGIQNCDLLLAIGSRISGRITGGNIKSFARDAKKYLVDVDEALCQRQLQQLPFDESIFCDAMTFCSALEKEIDQYLGFNTSNPSWLHKVISWRERYDPVKSEFFEQEAIHPYTFIRTLSRKMDANAVLVADCGGNIVVCNHAFETKWGQRYFTNNGNSPMGFSMCGAIGAWFADPSRQVVCVIGDGGMNLNIQELATIKNYGVNIKVFILNNHSYGITRAFQETHFGGRLEACSAPSYAPPDFIGIARAYGIRHQRIPDTAYMAEDIGSVLSHDGPVICDVDCGDFHSYFPRIAGWNTPIEDMEPRLPRDEFRANMTIDPLPGWETGEY